MRWFWGQAVLQFYITFLCFPFLSAGEEANLNKAGVEGFLLLLPFSFLSVSQLWNGGSEFPSWFLQGFSVTTIAVRHSHSPAFCITEPTSQCIYEKVQLILALCV